MGYVTIPARDLHQITFAGWVNFLALGYTQNPLRIFSFNASNKGWQLAGHAGPGKLFASVVMHTIQSDCDDNINQTYDWDTVSISDGNWHHIAITGDSDPTLTSCTTPANIACYFDGSDEGLPDQDKDPEGRRQTANIVTLAISAAANSAFAEIGIWNRILTPAEISNLGSDRYTPSLISSGLLASWRMLGDEDPEPGISSLVDDTDINLVDGWSEQYDHPTGIVTSLGIDSPTTFDPTSNVDPDTTVHLEKAVYGRNNVFLEITDYNATGTTTEWQIWPVDANARFPFLTRDYPKTYTTYGGPYEAGTYKNYRGSIRHLHLWVPPLIWFNYRYRQLGGSCTGIWSETRTMRAT